MSTTSEHSTRPGIITGGASRDWSGMPHTYYGVPFIKKAHWGWEIIVYFFLGGVGGTAYLVTTLAHLLGGKEDAPLVRAGRYLSLVCMMLSPILLIKDLGRPERFHHMLRVIKLRSAMSLGTWGITLFGLCTGITTAHQAAHDGLLRWFPALGRLMRALPVKALEVPGSILGIFVASYTGVLLSSTAVPLWGRAKHILGPLFLTSGLSAALASLTLLLAPRSRNQKTLEKIEDCELVALTTELGFILALPPTLGPLSKPLWKGKLGKLFVTGALGSGTLLPLGTHLAWKLRGKPTPRSINVASALLVLIGGIILRTVWVLAGRRSADDPQAVNYYNAIEEKGKR